MSKHTPHLYSAVAILLIACGQALGQQPATTKTPPKSSRPAATTPAATPAAPAIQPAITENRKEPEVGPYVTMSSLKDYNLTVRVRLASDNPTMKERVRDPHTGETVDMPTITPFEFQTMGIVWPIIPSTGSSIQQVAGFTGVLRLNGLVTAGEYKILDGYPAGVRLARWDAAAEPGQSLSCRQVQLDVTVRATIGKTAFDEAAAIKVPWPKGAWPTDVAASLAPQLYVETGLDGNNQIKAYEDAPLDAAIKTWLADAKVADAKRISPVALAKILTRGVWGAVQINDRTISSKGLGFGEITTRTGEFGGVTVQPPFQTLQSGRGSSVDAVALLAALMKKTGLPARTVIGWDTGKNSDNKVSRNVTGRRGDNLQGLRYWVEFPVYDEAKNTINWVPVDITKIQKSSSRPKSLEVAWRYFGENDELNTVMPFAFQFHPPTDVVAYGAPAFWGWFVTPKAPDNAEQVVNFDAATASKRGGEDPAKATQPSDDKKNEDKKKEDKKDERKKKIGY